MTENDETERNEHSDKLPDDRPLPGDGNRQDDRPMPGNGTRDSDSAQPDSHTASKSDGKSDEDSSESDGDSDDDETPAGPDAEPVYNDRDKLDFDPDEGFYTGTAVTGDTEIPGEHERVDDVPVDEEGNATSDSDDDSDDDKSDDDKSDDDESA